ncbi:hypothetical protein Tco_0849033 [Tanacetum coccineum]
MVLQSLSLMKLLMRSMYLPLPMIYLKVGSCPRNTNTSQAVEIATLKERVKKLEKKRRSTTYKPKRLYKVGLPRRIESSKESLGAQKDASTQGRKIADLDADAEVTLVDETQGGNNEENLMFDTSVLDGDEVFIKHIVTNVITTTTTIDDELTIAKTLIAIKAAKPKVITTIARTVTPVITTAATTVTPIITWPKEKGVVVQEPSETTTTTTLAQPSSKDKELAYKLHVEEQAELERMQRESVAQEEVNRAAIIEELDSIQAMIEADEKLAIRLQAEEQKQFSIEEKSRMLVEMIAERKKLFAAQRAAEQRS